jgi:hypothetical protein
MDWSLLAVPEQDSLPAPERIAMPGLELPVALQLECQPADFQQAATCDTPLEK